MNQRLRGSAAHVFVDSLTAPQLTHDDDHHLRRVLRIRDSDEITLGDGAGSWVAARLRHEELSVESDPVFEAAPHPAGVVCAIPKGDRPEWIVQKLTEIGATAIGFMDCARSVVRWDVSRAERQIERMRRVAREAAMQSRRLWLPTIRDVMPFGAAALSPRCAIADLAGSTLTDDVDTVLVGPEGGFTEGELNSVSTRVTLSRNVLRVETAALAAAFLLTQRHDPT